MSLPSDSLAGLPDVVSIPKDPERSRGEMDIFQWVRYVPVAFGFFLFLLTRCLSRQVILFSIFKFVCCFFISI